MSDDLRNQIYRNFDQKETNELLGIWKTNNREEWSDQAFEVLEEILKKRNIDLPLQQDLVIENQNEANDEDNLEDWEIKLLDNENQPDFYDTIEVLNLKNNIIKLAKIYVVVFIILAIFNLRSLQGLFIGIFPSMEDLPLMILSVVIPIVASWVEIAVVYFALKALSQILRILMEMEFNSRGLSRNSNQLPF